MQNANLLVSFTIILHAHQTKLITSDYFRESNLAKKVGTVNLIRFNI